MTYPDHTVQELLASFVCVRVEFDRERELAKQFGVQPLPDIRVLEADGRPAAHAAGFVSPARLTALLRAALDGGAGATSGAAAPTSRAAGVAAATTAGEAMARARAFLREAAHTVTVAADGFSPDGLTLYALAATGVARDDAAVVAVEGRLAGAPAQSTYEAATRALAYSRLDAAAHRQQLTACASLLLAGQLAGGDWSYGSASDAATRPALGDHSNSAFALLGLLACARSGVDVPRDAVVKAEASWRAAQNADGGWGYRTDREAGSYASMTENGISSLLIAGRLTGRSLEGDPAVLRGLAWLSAHFSVTENVASGYQQGRLLYHLFALERLGSILAAKEVARHAWHADGTAFLLAHQSDDGSFDDGADTPVPNTAFGLLFLGRATADLR